MASAEVEVRVALDMTPACLGETGVARYARELNAALIDAGVSTRTFRVPAPLRLVHASWRLAGRPRAERLAQGRGMGGAGGAGRTGGSAGQAPDLVHSLDLVAPPTRLPLVMTIHDTAAVDHPELHPARSVGLQRRRLAQAREADAVLVNSTATAADAARHGVDPARITVTPLGATAWPAARSTPPIDALGSGFVLAVGETHPRKNLTALVAALAVLAAAGRRPPTLVVAGPAGTDEASLRSRAAAAGIELRRVTGAADAVLATLYHRAALLALPSRAEGFGLPVLEAMAAGLPVVASDLPALDELTGGTAVLVRRGHEGPEGRPPGPEGGPPGPEGGAPGPDGGPGSDPAGEAWAWAGALGRVLDDPGAAAAMAARARERAAGFTWARTAESTLAAYRAVLDRS